MFGIKPKTGGLFGGGLPPHRSPYETPPIAGNPGMGAPGLGEQRKPGIGTRLFGRGWEDKAYALGGLLAGDGGAAIADYRQMQMAPAMEAAKREAMLADYEAKKQIDQRYAPPPSNDDLYSYFDDNAGNRWRQNKQTGEVDARPAFVDTTPKAYVQDGQLIRVGNPWAGSAPETIGEDLWNQGTPVGQGGPSQPATGGFPGRR